MSLSRISLIVALLSLGSTSMVGAVSYPSTGPAGSYSGGSFGTYFQNLISNPCSPGQVVTSFSTGSSTYGRPNCVFASLPPGSFGDTAYYNGTSWVASNVIYNDAVNVGIGLGGLAPQARLEVGGGVKIANDAGVCVAGKAGTIRYNGTNIQFCDGTIWGSLGGGGWGLAGNTGTTAGTNFIGTTDAQDLVFKTNNIEKMRIFSTMSSSGQILTMNGGDASINGVIVGKGSGAIAFNTALGALTLASITTGNANTAVGHNGLNSLTSGNYNTSIGGGVLTQITTGSYNTAGGFTSQNNNLTGSYNTSYGARSLNVNQTGGNNSVFGYRAGNILTSSNNVLLGYQAGDALTTGSNNIVLGYDIDVPTPTSSNTLNIGNLLFGTGINGTNTTLSTGNIGIGTTSPAAKLEVAGGVKIGADASTCDGTKAGTIRYNGSSVEYCNGSVWGSMGGGGSVGWSLTGNTATNSATNFIGTTDAQDLVFKTNNGEKLRIIDASGDILIDGVLKIGNGTSSNLGNIAIGKDSLTSSSAGWANIAIGSGVLANANYTFPNRGSANIGIGDTVLQSSTSGYYNVGVGYMSLDQLTTGSSNVTLGMGTLGEITTGSRNVAIGQSSLSVASSSSADNVSVGYAAGSAGGLVVGNVFIGSYAGYNATGSGNVAIGYESLSTATGTDFQTAVGYQALRSNTTGVSNTAVGYRGLYANTTGNSNTANGFSALGLNTTGNSNTANGVNALYSNTIGFQNTANGASALYSNTTGFQNTANGLSALSSNTTGQGNTANGAYALRNNTTGNSNTANGQNALYTNITGYSNTANGVFALYSNFTGYSNTANGMQALYSNTTGVQNTANGQSTLGFNTTGSNNTANGVDALYSNTTGSGNVANGASALYSNSTGLFNTANGYQSLYSNTTGSGNTVLGSQAGFNITTGSSNIAIGNNSQVVSSTGSNQLSIGNWIYGSGGNIGIGTSAPTAKLDVNGDVKIGNNLVLSGGSTSSILGHPAGFLSLGLQGGSKLLTINSSGNVGVGPLNPSADFEISDVAEAKLRLNSGNASIWDISTNFGVNNNLVVTPFSGSGNVVFSGTNIGIGTATPGAKLHVQNAGELISVFTNTNASTDPTWNVSIGNGGQFAQGYFTVGVGATPSVATHSLRLTSDGGATFRAYASAPSFRSLINGVGDGQIMGWTNTGGNFNGYLSLGATHTNAGTTGSDTRIYMGTNTASKVDIRDWSDNVKMTVLQNGNVGIGTSSPTDRLTVSGSALITSDLTVQGKVISDTFVNRTVNNVTISGSILPDLAAPLAYRDIGNNTTQSWNNLYLSGQVTIKGGTPGVNKVLISDATGLATWQTVPASLSSWNILGNSGTVAGTNFLGTTDNIDLVFRRNNIEGMRLSGASGNLVTTADATINGVRVGRGGGNIATNTAVGSGALSSNTTGFSNTANGADALLSNTTGTSNTANGVNALLSNTTGIENTANGLAALRLNIGGNRNTANGNAALATNSTGSFNTANGWRALFANTTGSNNTALGRSAGYNITTGSFNIAIGDNAQVTSFTGSNQLNIGNWIYGSDGNIGIGTTTPGAKLEVAGQVKITGGSPGIGKALISDATGLASWGTPINCTASGSGLNNICYGTFSLQNNTTGQNNVAYGDEALRNNNGGSANVSLGYGSMYYNTSGSSNVGIGVYALNSNTTGGANIGIGTDSLAYASTVSYNIALGSSSQKENRSGNNNVAVGAEALRLNFTGSFNSAFGNAAATQMQSTASSFVGGNNAFGAYALQGGSSTGSLNTGYANSAFGNYALLGTTGTPTTGFQNSAFGNTSLQTITSGSDNVGVGYGAGNGLTTGSNNIFIGANIAPVSNTASNQLSIGNWIYGSGGNIGIGTSSPTQKLHVNGNVLADAFLYVSDARMKQDVTGIENAEDILTKLQGVRFVWKADGRADIGFIAQEVEKVLPELVHTDSAGMKSVEYANIIPVLVEGYKVERARADGLEDRLQSLEARLEFLEKSAQ